MAQVPQGDSNIDSIEFFRAVNRAMRLTSGIEAVTLLCCSERVCSDLKQYWPKYACAHIYSWIATEKREEFPMSVIVRKWCSIDPSLEFRAFVHCNKITAISQYLHSCFFPNLPSRKHQLKEMAFHCC